MYLYCTYNSLDSSEARLQPVPVSIASSSSAPTQPLADPKKIIKKATNGQDMMSSNHPSHLRLTSLTCSDSGTRRTTSGTEILMY